MRVLAIVSVWTLLWLAMPEGLLCSAPFCAAGHRPPHVPSWSRAALADSMRGPDIGDTLVTDLRESVTDALVLFGGPSRFTGTDWLLVGSGALATGLGMAVDDSVRALALRSRSRTLDDLAAIGNRYGTPLPALIVGGVLYCGGLAADAPGVRRAGRHVFQAVLYAGLVTTTVKALAGRHRPQLGDGPFVFSGPTLRDPHHSFPSGHATLAFALSSVLAAEIDHPLATVALYAAATVTAASRVYADRHWTSDTILGAMVGTACGYGVANLPTGDATTGWLVMPTSNGLMAIFRF